MVVEPSTYRSIVDSPKSTDAKTTTYCGYLSQMDSQNEKINLETAPLRDEVYEEVGLNAVIQSPGAPSSEGQALGGLSHSAFRGIEFLNTAGWRHTASYARTGVEGPSLKLQTARLCYPSACVAAAESGRCNPSKESSETAINNSDLQ